MRRVMVAVPVLEALLAPGGAPAAPSVVPPAPWQAAQPVQYYGGPDPAHRYHRRQARRAHEEARIAAAARREARRIEIERAHRRAYRQAQRERYGYYR